MNSKKMISALAVFGLTGVAALSTAYAGTAKVTLGSESFSLNDVKCEGGPESFSVQASVDHGSELLQLAAFKGEVQTVGFRAGDMMAQVVDQTGTFDGNRFKFQGEAQVYTLDSINRSQLNVTVDC